MPQTDSNTPLDRPAAASRALRRASTILSVTSGKGGVGKSIVSVNLAETLVAEGYRVALLDADFGQSSSPVLLNERPEASVLDFVRHAARQEQLLCRTSSGVMLAEAVAEAGQADGYEAHLYDALDDFLMHLQGSYDYIIIDAPAGADTPVRWALDRAHLGVLVVTSDPTAILDAYRLAKLIWQIDATYPMGLVVNAAKSKSEAQELAGRFCKATEQFTGQLPELLGWIPYAVQIRYSVQMQAPAVRTPGPVQDAFRRLARTLVQGRHDPAGAPEAQAAAPAQASPATS